MLSRATCHLAPSYSASLLSERLVVFPRLLNTFSRFLTGIDIHPGATLGPGLFIDHGMGLVIGETAELGSNVTLYQGVTLGGTGKEKVSAIPPSATMLLFPAVRRYSVPSR